MGETDGSSGAAHGAQPDEGSRGKPGFFGRIVEALTPREAEVAADANGHPAPQIPARGMINLRGTVIPVVDVRIRLGLEPREPGARNCIVVVRVAGDEVGLLVDEVRDVVEIPAEAIQPAARRNAAPAAQAFVRGLGLVDGEVRILLDSRRLLYAGREVDAPEGGEAGIRSVGSA